MLDQWHIAHHLQEYISRIMGKTDAGIDPSIMYILGESHQLIITAPS
jgi:hypothetical protein